MWLRRWMPYGIRPTAMTIRGHGVWMTEQANDQTATGRKYLAPEDVTVEDMSDMRKLVEQSGRVTPSSAPGFDHIRIEYNVGSLSVPVFPSEAEEMANEMREYVTAHHVEWSRRGVDDLLNGVRTLSQAKRFKGER